MLFRIFYRRVRQLVRSWQAVAFTPPELDFIRQTLLPAQQVMFLALPLYEQRHAWNVCQTLVRGGFGTDRELLQAALLHDLGKRDPRTGRAIPVVVKVVNVVLTLLVGRRAVRKLGRSRPGSWRYYFWLQASHEKRGARLVQSSGGSPRVVALVGRGRKLQRQGDPAALALQWADDLN